MKPNLCEHRSIDRMRIVNGLGDTVSLSWRCDECNIGFQPIPPSMVAVLNNQTTIPERVWLDPVSRFDSDVEPSYICYKNEVPWDCMPYVLESVLTALRAEVEARMNTTSADAPIEMNNNEAAAWARGVNAAYAAVCALLAVRADTPSHAGGPQ